MKITALTLNKTRSSTSFDYYVDPVSGSDVNDGMSEGAAFLTTGKALTTVGTSGGKSIGLMDGNHGYLSSSLIFTAPVVIESVNPLGATCERIGWSSLCKNTTFRNLTVVNPDPGSPKDPAQTLDVCRFGDGVEDVTIEGCDISGEALLRTGRAIRVNANSSTSLGSTRLAIRNNRLHHCGMGMVRYAGGASADVVVDNNIMHDFCLSAIGTSDTVNGWDITNNIIYNSYKAIDDPDWTGAADNYSGSWNEAHYSLISIRDTHDLLIANNVFFSLRSPWMQFYGGEGRTFYYGRVTIRDNLMYDIPPSSYILLFQNYKTVRDDWFSVTGNTFVVGQPEDWIGTENYRNRFNSTNLDMRSLGAKQTGDTFENNLLVCKCTRPNWTGTRNNYFWYDNYTDVPDGTDNVEIERTHWDDINWIDKQFAEGNATFKFRSHEGRTRVKGGYSFAPKSSSALATAGVDGTYVGAVAPA